MVGPVETAKIAVRALRLNAMRSLLTILGIVIGVAAVILIVAVVDGAHEMIAEQIRSMGSNTIIVNPETVSSPGSFSTRHNLTASDAEAITKRCSAVNTAAPTWGQSARVVVGNRNWQTNVTGTTVPYFTVRGWKIRWGRIFTEDENLVAAKVCVLGTTVVQKLFGQGYPIGQVVRIGEVPCRVIGVLQSKGRLSRGDDTDDVVLVPLTTAQIRLFGTTFPDEVQSIMARASQTSLIQAGVAQVDRLLTARHKIGRKQDKDFSISTTKEMLDATRETMKIMTLLLAAIMSISLVVGGIGIMNIMLVSVSERTREIGVRMAVGARPSDILVQFLVEATTLSIMGGIVGLLLGIGSSYVSTHVTTWPVTISPIAAIAAVGCSATVGISFGFYPAYKASKLHPIEALRYE